MKTGFRGIVGGICSLFTKPASKIGLGVLVTGGFLAGALFWGGFNYGMEKTNEEEFCLSCHTMKDNLLPELQKTVHWQNRTGCARVVPIVMCRIILRIKLRAKCRLRARC